MNRSIGEDELELLLQAARAAGDAEGYARAKFEMALEKAKGAIVSTTSTIDVPTQVTSRVRDSSKTEKLQFLEAESKKINENQEYRTRVTVSMTRAIALDYIKSVAPRIVGPSEIKKNSEKNLGVFISFGTLQRAMPQLVESGEIELIEQSRWRYKGRSDSASLRSIK